MLVVLVVLVVLVETSMSVVAYGSTMVVRPYYSSAMVVRHLLW